MTVIGAGSYGTALAITLARNGHDVVLWGHDPKHVAALEQARCNQAFLPDVSFPDSLYMEASLQKAIEASRNILVVIPSHVFGEVLQQIKPFYVRMHVLFGRQKVLKHILVAYYKMLPVKY